MELFFIAMQGIRAIISDVAKGIEEIGVQITTLQALQISIMRLSCHLMSNNIKTLYSSRVRFAVKIHVREDARVL